MTGVYTAADVAAAYAAGLEHGRRVAESATDGGFAEEFLRRRAEMIRLAEEPDSVNA